MVFEWGPGTRRVGYPLWQPGLSLLCSAPRAAGSHRQEHPSFDTVCLVLSPGLGLGLGTCMWMELQFSGQWVGEQVAGQVVGAQYVGSCGPGLWWLGIKEDLWKGQEPAFQFTIWIPVSLAPWLGV